MQRFLTFIHFQCANDGVAAQRDVVPVSFTQSQLVTHQRVRRDGDQLQTEPLRVLENLLPDTVRQISRSVSRAQVKKRSTVAKPVDLPSVEWPIVFRFSNHDSRSHPASTGGDRGCNLGVDRSVRFYAVRHWCLRNYSVETITAHVLAFADKTMLPKIFHFFRSM